MEFQITLVQIPIMLLGSILFPISIPLFIEYLFIYTFKDRKEYKQLKLKVYLSLTIFVLGGLAFFYQWNQFTYDNASYTFSTLFNWTIGVASLYGISNIIFSILLFILHKPSAKRTLFRGLLWLFLMFIFVLLANIPRYPTIYPSPI